MTTKKDLHMLVWTATMTPHACTHVCEDEYYIKNHRKYHKKIIGKITEIIMAILGPFMVNM